MPTAAKLVAAVLLAALGFGVSELVKTLMPASTAFGIFSIINAGLGLVIGWVVVGNRAGRGQAAAVGNGITGVVSLVFWCLFVHSVHEMVNLANRRHYDGPVEAFADVFQIMIDYGEVLVNPLVLAILLLGSLVVGYLSEIAAGRWR